MKPSNSKGSVFEENCFLFESKAPCLFKENSERNHPFCEVSSFEANPFVVPFNGLIAYTIHASRRRGRRESQPRKNTRAERKQPYSGRFKGETCLGASENIREPSLKAKGAKPRASNQNSLALIVSKTATYKSLPSGGASGSNGPQ